MSFRHIAELALLLDDALLTYPRTPDAAPEPAKFDMERVMAVWRANALDVAAEVSTLVRALSARPQPAAKLALLDTAAVDTMLRGLRYPNAFLPVPSEASLQRTAIEAEVIYLELLQAGRGQ